MLFLILLMSYLIGNFLPALQIGKQIGKSIRAEGSGNPGAKNVGRVFGKKAFIFVLALDAGKGAFVVWMASMLDGRLSVQLLALMAVILGHCYPILHRFQGGKGAAAFIGGLLVFNASFVLPIVLCFAVLYGLVKKVTAASVLATIAIVPYSVWLYDENVALLTLGIVVLLLWTHRADIQFPIGRNQTR